MIFEKEVDCMLCSSCCEVIDISGEMWAIYLRKSMNIRLQKQSSKVWWIKGVTYITMIKGVLIEMSYSKQLYPWIVHLNLGDKPQKVHPWRSSLPNLKVALTKVPALPRQFLAIFTALDRDRSVWEL